MNQQTFIEAPQDDPVNLDMSSFAKELKADEEMLPPLKSDTDIINEAMAKHITFK